MIDDDNTSIIIKKKKMYHTTYTCGIIITFLEWSFGAAISV